MKRLIPRPRLNRDGETIQHKDIGRAVCTLDHKGVEHVFRVKRLLAREHLLLHFGKKIYIAPAAHTWWADAEAQAHLEHEEKWEKYQAVLS